MTDRTIKIIFFIGIGLSAFWVRLVPHPANFTPVGALAIFFGAKLQKRYALTIPLLIMLASDLFVGFYDWRLMAVVYISFVLMATIGILIRKNANPIKILAGSLAGSSLFFLITNSAVWFFSSWYQKNLSGLTMSYVLGLPFFKNSLLADLFYSVLFFGVYEIICQRKFIVEVLNGKLNFYKIK